VLNWISEERFVSGSTTFQVLPADLKLGPGALDGVDMSGADFLVFKPRSLVEQYVEWLDRIRPANLVELGVYQGGSTAMLAEIVRPRSLVAIDLKPIQRAAALRRYVESSELGDAIHVHGEVDQGDRARLAEIVDEAIEGDIDLVIDDCSHLYGPTSASFNELFPRLRPGGVYMIEDWRWAHPSADDDDDVGMFPGEVPLTRLIFDLVLAVPWVPGVIADITVTPDSVLVTRGEAEVEPSGFDVAACSNPRGRALLASI
jgi:SAM-dependent methyltransferase